ncbi:MAG: hypothetical protein Q9157_001329 [Trypethelium eluteriae]
MAFQVTTELSPAVFDYKPPNPPLKEFVPSRDRAFFGDPEKASLLAQASAVDNLTPYVGTELKGIQLSRLTDAQKDELALLVAERGVVFFRDQDITLEQQHALAAYYGIIEIPTSKIRAMLQSLDVKGIFVPMVRTHPVTRLKILNYNPWFITRIAELNAQESNHILAFLREHLLQADDLTVRWRWTAGAVAFWDNRAIVHKATPGGYDVTLREGKRTAIFGERPFWDPDNSESLSQRIERLQSEKGENRENGIHSQSVLNN